MRGKERLREADRHGQRLSSETDRPETDREGGVRRRGETQRERESEGGRHTGTESKFRNRPT